MRPRARMALFCVDGVADWRRCLEECDPTHHSGSLGAIFRALVGLPALPAASSRANVVGRSVQQGGSALQGHIRRRDRRDRGSTSSTSAAIGAQRCQGCGKRFWIERRPKDSVRPAAASCVRPRSAGARPRAALLAARTARRPSLASSPPWPSTPTSCPATSACGSSWRKVWLPAIESGVRADTLRLSHAGRAAPRAAARSGAAAELKRRPDQRPLRQAAQ